MLLETNPRAAQTRLDSIAQTYPDTPVGKEASRLLAKMLGQEFAQIIAGCDERIGRRPANCEAFCERADAYGGEWKKAIDDYTIVI